MKETKYNCRTFVNHRNQVIVRVRWNKKKFEVAFPIGLHADPLKWNVDSQRPMRGSTHIIGNERNPSRIINERIDIIRGAIDEAFAEFALAGAMPTADELRDLVNEKTGLTTHDGEDDGSEKTLQEIFNEFLIVNARERDWSSVVHHRYERVWQNLIDCDPEVSFDTLNKDKMIELKEWYVKVKKDRNRTITRQFRTLKSILRWMKANGYPVQESAIEYSPRLTVTKKNVTYLTREELNHFFNFQFPSNLRHLERARDLFCFMAFTSLRYSDLARLKHANITSKGIDLYTKKTSDHITIPIIDDAKKLLDKYADYKPKNGNLFPVPSSQKLNDYIKEAAKLAGLDREVIDTYCIGTERHDDVQKIHEILSCHDGRRTFVCCSLAFGIPAAIVMSITGHKDYESMKPYIEIANDTKRFEMEKWNGNETKMNIMKELEEFDKDKLIQVYEFVKALA
jgi:integrase